MAEKKFFVVASPGFADWLLQNSASLAFSTYETGKLFLLGLRETGELSLVVRTIERCLGLWSDGQTLWISSKSQIWRFENQRPNSENASQFELASEFDRFYAPINTHHTGALDVHDLVIDATGQLVFANTLFSCLATVSDRHSFSPIWKPPFITKLVPEDRCHLNGVAIEQGEVRYATMFSQSNIPEGWRSDRESGGFVWSLKDNVAVCNGLSMPHSPRCYDGRLWVLDSGNGEFGYVELPTGRFQCVAYCPGYPRGLAFLSHFAIIGISQPRDRTFRDLPIGDRLKYLNLEPITGLIIVDLVSGNVVESLRIEGVVKELYDVVVLPGIRRPTASTIHPKDIERQIWFSDNGKLVNWCSQVGE